MSVAAKSFSCAIIGRACALLLCWTLAVELHIGSVASAATENGADIGVTFDDWLLRAYADEPEAQFLVGVSFAEGQVVARDLAEAARWYRRAATQGHAEAQYNLADCYLRGRGVAQDPGQAVHWWQQSARQDYVLAQSNLGRAYYLGIGTAKDLRRARHWLAKAGAGGDRKALTMLAQLGETPVTAIDKSRLDPIEPTWVFHRFVLEQGGTAHIIGRGVRARGKPGRGTDSPVVGFFKPYQTVVILERDGDWLRVRPEDSTTATVSRRELVPAPAGTPEPTGVVEEVKRQTPDTVSTLPVAAATAPAAAPTPGPVAHQADNAGSSTPTTAQLPVSDRHETADNERWLYRQPGANYTIQLMSSREQDQARAAAEKFDQPQARYFVTRRGDQSWFYVLYGSFTSRTAARRAADSADLKSVWIRPFGSIQDNRCRNASRLPVGVAAELPQLCARNEVTAKSGIGADPDKSATSDDVRTIRIQKPQPGPSAQMPRLENDNRWLYGQAPSNFTIQLLSTSSELRAREFIQQHQLSQAGYFSTHTEGRKLFYILHGSYPSRTVADDVAKTLPVKSVWIRRFGRLQALRCRKASQLPPAEARGLSPFCPG